MLTLTLTLALTRTLTLLALLSLFPTITLIPTHTLTLLTLLSLTHTLTLTHAHTSGTRLTRTRVRLRACIGAWALRCDPLPTPDTQTTSHFESF